VGSGLEATEGRQTDRQPSCRVDRQSPLVTVGASSFLVGFFSKCITSTTKTAQTKLTDELASQLRILTDVDVSCLGQGAQLRRDMPEVWVRAVQKLDAQDIVGGELHLPFPDVDVRAHDILG
jgi:hypothetical protein